MQLLTFWTFVWRCFGRAASDTAHWIELSFRSVIAAVVLFVLGFGLYWLVRGASETKDELSKYAVLTVVPFLLFITGLFLVNLFRAPYAIYKLEQAKVQNELLDATTRNKQLSAENEALERDVRNLRVDQERLAPIAPKLTNVRDPRERRKAERTQIAQLIDLGLQIQHNCMTDQENPELETAANNWADKTFKYLATIESSYASRFNASNGPSYSHKVGRGPSEASVPESNERVWNFLNHRIETLKVLLSELRD